MWRVLELTDAGQVERAVIGDDGTVTGEWSAGVLDLLRRYGYPTVPLKAVVQELKGSRLGVEELREG